MSSEYKLRPIDVIGYAKDADPPAKQTYALRECDVIGYAKEADFEKPKTHTYRLRDIDRPKPGPKPATADNGICECGHERKTHYHGATDHHGLGWHACLSAMCPCTKYANEGAK